MGLYGCMTFPDLNTILIALAITMMLRTTWGFVGRWRRAP
jgi:hypothetical protein